MRAIFFLNLVLIVCTSTLVFFLTNIQHALFTCIIGFIFGFLLERFGISKISVAFMLISLFISSREIVRRYFIPTADDTRRTLEPGAGGVFWWLIIGLLLILFFIYLFGEKQSE